MCHMAYGIEYIGVVCSIDVDVVSQYMVYMVYNCVYYCVYYCDTLFNCVYNCVYDCMLYAVCCMCIYM
jgi:hypothetical protein